MNTEFQEKLRKAEINRCKTRIGSIDNQIKGHNAEIRKFKRKRKETEKRLKYLIDS
jgi:predicted  nucleic acid-binding Zn-ribbon protein